MLQLFHTFAQDTLSDPTNYTFTTDSTAASASYEGFMGIIVIACIIAYVLQSIALWRLFTKAGKPGWAGIIPVYNLFVVFQITGRSPWWLALLLLAPIPVVGLIAALVVSVIMALDLSKSFGRGVGTTVLLILLPIIGFFVLAFGGAEYKGPAALQTIEEPGYPTDKTPPTDPSV